jgi:hypothetical protein
MHDGGKVIAGIVIFLVVVLFPVWFSVASGGAGSVPEWDPKAKEPECVEEKEYMRIHHMELLDDWRDEVVREAGRTHVSPSGREHDKSLTRTCLGCHRSKAEFCDRCHDYAGVEPTCWDCHVVPEGDQ